MSRLAVFGTGGFAREVFPLAKAQSEMQMPPQELVFVEDKPDSSQLFGTPVLQTDKLTGDDLLVIAVGRPGDRKSIVERLGNLCFVGVSAKSFVKGEDVHVGDGAIFCDYTIVTGSATIGRFFQCNIYSYVAHDCVIGDFVTFAPRVCCNGNVRIEDGAYIGTGAVLKQGEKDKPLIIGAGAIVGMGAVVTKSVAPGAVVVGNPARPIEKK
jgi:sugar O-acyltransferase (sialic acid O-acetyltransferase NeuD family)